MNIQGQNNYEQNNYNFENYGQIEENNNENNEENNEENNANDESQNYRHFSVYNNSSMVDRQNDFKKFKYIEFNNPNSIAWKSKKATEKKKLETNELSPHKSVDL